MNGPSTQEITDALEAGAALEKIEKLGPTKHDLIGALGAVVTFFHRRTLLLTYFYPYRERPIDDSFLNVDPDGLAPGEWRYRVLDEDMPDAMKVERWAIFNELMNPKRDAQAARSAELSANVGVVSMANGVAPARTIPAWREDDFGRKTGALNVRRWGRRQRVS